MDFSVLFAPFSWLLQEHGIFKDAFSVEKLHLRFQTEICFLCLLDTLLLIILVGGKFCFPVQIFIVVEFWLSSVWFLRVMFAYANAEFWMSKF